MGLIHLAQNKSPPVGKIKKTTKNRGVLQRTVFRNTVYLERGMPYFAFVDTKAVLVRKIDEA